MSIGTIIGLWCLASLYVVIGVVIASCNSSKWYGKKYEIPIKLFFVFLWPLVIILFPIWIVWKFVGVSVENRKIRKNFAK